MTQKLICTCKNIEVGTYKNQVEIPYKELPKHMQEYILQRRGFEQSICLDKCIVHIIKDFRDKGLTTTGCCCGHGKRFGYVGVIEKDIPTMEDLHYQKDTPACIGNYVLPLFEL